MLIPFFASYLCLLSTHKFQKVNIQKKTDAAIVFDASKESVFKIKTNKATGTGFLFKNSNTVATCYHVIEGATAISVEGSNDAKWDVVSIQYNEKADVAVLTIDRPSSRKPLQPVKSLPQIGEKAFVIGNPLGFLTNSLTEGIVSAIRRDSEADATVIQVSAAISPGNSGSPILNAAGQVMGFASFSFSKGQSLNMGISHEELQKVLLKENLSSERFYNLSRLSDLSNDGSINGIHTKNEPPLPPKFSEKQKNDLGRLFEKISLTYIDAYERDEGTKLKHLAVSAFSEFWINSKSLYSELSSLPNLDRDVDMYKAALTRYSSAVFSYEEFENTLFGGYELLYKWKKEEGQRQLDNVQETKSQVRQSYFCLFNIFRDSPDLNELVFPGWLKFYNEFRSLRLSEDGIDSQVIPEPNSQACEFATSCFGPGGKAKIDDIVSNGDKSYTKAKSELEIVRRGDKLTEICDLNNVWHKVDNWNQLCNVLGNIKKRNVAQKTFQLKARVVTRKGSSIVDIWMGEVNPKIKEN